MKKRVFGRKLGRERGSRKALFRSVTRSLVEHGSIKTTKAKAKAVQPFVDRLVKIAKEGNDISKRRVFAMLGNDKKTAKGIFELVDKVFKKRESGFTRTTPLGRRKGDRAEMVALEFVEKIEIKEGKKKGKKETKPRKSKKS